MSMFKILIMFTLLLLASIDFIKCSILPFPRGTYNESCTSMTITKNLLCGKCKGIFNISCIPFFEDSYITIYTVPYYGKKYLIDLMLENSNAVVTNDIYPKGTYYQTCTDYEMFNNNLCAKCHYRDYEKCYGQECLNFGHSCIKIDIEGLYIINDNGILNIDYGKFPTFIFNSNNDFFPRGQYVASCKLNSIKNNVLTSKCKNNDNKYIDSSIIFTNNSYITNDNGILTDTTA